jgi:hypothetical protein
MRFEDLLNGKDITELTQQEIQDMIEKLELKEIDRFEEKLREGRKKSTTKKSVAAKKKKDIEFENLLNKGIK